MKSVTEFPTHKLVQGNKAKADLAAAGKSPEEISTALGESFKYEGDKLKHFVNAMEVATQNPDKLARVLVVQLNEGESAPPKAVKVEDFHYVPDFMQEARKPVMTKTDPKAAGKGRQGGGKGGKGGGRAKETPWGIIPEQKETKKPADKNAGAGGDKPTT